MTCTCYNNYFNPGCEEHGTQARERGQVAPTIKGDTTIVQMEKDDAAGMKRYYDLLERLRQVHRDLKEDGQRPSALILIAIDEEQRILSPMILTDDDVKHALPTVFDTIAQGLRKRIAN
jgi:hypothetical protein